MTPPEVSTPAIQKSSDLNAGIKKAGKVLTIDQSVRAVPLTAAQIKSLEKGGYTVNIKNSGSSSSSPDAVSAPTEDKNTSSAIKKLEDK